ncbi:hypothetical protein [Aliikangiella coralliicola]|uniref:Uncharacterized protein n=1 Tax=Aliikangiella coralliicola TaxID=2592383 RepID=A0A545U5W4_9GAMM|nr:hypothetical protein [Aliikangiella coralliicola]TQV84858.1 hypothetical protein FLL46_20885 [Aliikangiella coralliicola]
MHFLKKIKLVTAFLVFSIFPLNLWAVELSKHEWKFIESYLPMAAKSNHFSEVVAGIIIANQTGHLNQLELLYSRARAIGYENKLWVDHEIKSCLIAKENKNCDLELLISQLKKLDSENALPYVYSALFRAKNREWSLALADLEKAASRKKYDDYYFKRFSLLLEVLKNSDFPTEYLHTASIKLAHYMVVQPYKKLMDLCNAQAKLSRDWKVTCIQLGELLESEGTIFYANMVGFALQREALSNDEKDTKKLVKVKADREALNQWRINAVQILDFIEAKKKGPDSYYADLINLGERKAIENALKLITNKGL